MPVIVPVAVVKVTGVVLNSVVAMVNSVSLITANTKYLVPVCTPPNTVPVNCTFKSGYMSAVLLQVMVLVAADVAVQVTVNIVAELANKVC